MLVHCLCTSYFSCSCERLGDNQGRKKEGFILAPPSRVQFTMADKAWGPELEETAGWAILTATVGVLSRVSLGQRKSSFVWFIHLWS